jgi:hypothetical protein
MIRSIIPLFHCSMFHSRVLLNTDISLNPGNLGVQVFSHPLHVTITGVSPTWAFEGETLSKPD